jgi:hypothetical protein
LKIDSKAEFRFFEKAFIPGKSKIRNPKSKISIPTEQKAAQPILREGTIVAAL